MKFRIRHPALCIAHCALYIATAASAAAAEVRAEATGFFHVERIDGRDWAIDPQGRGVVLAGVDWVWPAGFFCEKLGYAPYGRFVETNYPSREVWADETAERLHAWGFNLLGSGCDDALLAPRGFVHTAMLNLGFRLAHDPDTTKALAVGLHRPGTAFPNVFHPDFEAECDRAAAAAAAKYRDDPWLLGYFLDNELSWGGETRNRDEGMFDAAMSWPPDHPARQAVEEFVALREPSPAMKREFLALVAERYFATMAGALRRHDPNHMVLGCRFAGMGASDVVLAAAGRHCDVVTVNLLHVKAEGSELAGQRATVKHLRCGAVQLQAVGVDNHHQRTKAIVAREGCSLPHGALVALAVSHHAVDARGQTLATSRQREAGRIAQAHAKTSAGELDAARRIATRLLADNGFWAKHALGEVILAEQARLKECGPQSKRRVSLGKHETIALLPRGVVNARLHHGA